MPSSTRPASFDAPINMAFRWNVASPGIGNLRGLVTTWFDKQPSLYFSSLRSDRGSYRMHSQSDWTRSSNDRKGSKMSNPFSVQSSFASLVLSSEIEDGRLIDIVARSASFLPLAIRAIAAIPASRQARIAANFGLELPQIRAPYGKRHAPLPFLSEPA